MVGNLDMVETRHMQTWLRAHFAFTSLFPSIVHDYTVATAYNENLGNEYTYSLEERRRFDMKVNYTPRCLQPEWVVIDKVQD